jgi:hypothetical protein
MVAGSVSIPVEKNLPVTGHFAARMRMVPPPGPCIQANFAMCVRVSARLGDVPLFSITGILHPIKAKTQFRHPEQYITHMPGTPFGEPARSRRNKTRRCSLTLCAGAWRLTMESERDVWNTTYLHRAIRKRIGETLSTGYDLSKPLPDRMRALLVQLEKPSAERATDRAHPLPPNSSQ